MAAHAAGACVHELGVVPGDRGPGHAILLDQGLQDPLQQRDVREDMNEQGLSPRQVVDVVSHFAGQTRVAPGFVVVEYPIPRRCAAMYYPESNVLAPIGSTEPLSNIPTYKSIVISLHPATP